PLTLRTSPKVKSGWGKGCFPMPFFPALALTDPFSPLASVGQGRIRLHHPLYFPSTGRSQVFFIEFLTLPLSRSSSTFNFSVPTYMLNSLFIFTKTDRCNVFVT
ncbi:hypothetical protein, partial [Anoxybacillus ayderensis]|uniref:hypothetical protein n=1 Tax=Anoxybacillus ayderensis TaxID=265546 RepID=UPI002E2164AB|nr:hypothetical protein [Anoxybacillus ayderensis]